MAFSSDIFSPTARARCVLFLSFIPSLPLMLGTCQSGEGATEAKKSLSWPLLLLTFLFRFLSLSASCLMAVPYTLRSTTPIISEGYRGICCRHLLCFPLYEKSSERGQEGKKEEVACGDHSDATVRADLFSFIRCILGFLCWMSLAFFSSSSSSLPLSSISTMVGDIYFLSWLQLIIIICCRCVAVRAGATHLSSVSSDDGKAYSCSIIYILYILLRRYTSYYAFCFGVSFSLQGEDPFRLL